MNLILRDYYWRGCASCVSARGAVMRSNRRPRTAPQACNRTGVEAAQTTFPPPDMAFGYRIRCIPRVIPRALSRARSVGLVDAVATAESSLRDDYHTIILQYSAPPRSPPRSRSIIMPSLRRIARHTPAQSATYPPQKPRHSTSLYHSLQNTQPEYCVPRTRRLRISLAVRLD